MQKGVSMDGNLTLENILTKKKNRELPEHLKKMKGSLSQINELNSSEDARLNYLLKKYK